MAEGGPGRGRGRPGLTLNPDLLRKYKVEPDGDQLGEGRGGRGRGAVRSLIGHLPVAEHGPGSTSPTPPGSPTEPGTPTPPSGTSPTPSTSPLAISSSLDTLRIAAKGQEGISSGNLEKIENKDVGKDGNAIKACVNYVKLSQVSEVGIHCYHVRFEPDIDSRPVRSRVLKTAAVKSVTGDVSQFTGMNMYLPRKLDNEVTIVTSEMPTDQTPVMVTIEYIKKPPAEELIAFFNILFRRVMHILKMVQINRHFYMPEAKIDIPQHKLEIWPGWATAIQEFDGGLLLSCDASHRVLRRSTARDVLMEVKRTAPDSFRETVLKRLVGAVVLTRYNNKPYRIDDVDFTQNPKNTFPKSDGTTISYFDYFKKTWDITLADLGQPLLINRPKPKRGQVGEPNIICLIPELSFMTGLTDDIRSDFRAMRDIATHTRIAPAVRNQKLMEFLKNVDDNPEAKIQFTNWGLKLDLKPVFLEARHISPEEIIFGNKTARVNEKCDWSRDATNSALITPVAIKSWLFVYTRRDSTKAEDFLNNLKNVSRCMGFQFCAPTKIEINDDLPATYCNSIRASFKQEMQLVVIMTPGNSQREDRYNAIKKICCCDLAVPSQVLRCGTVCDERKARSVCQKVALQISCKVGSGLWTVKIPFKSAMFVGIDVYHDASQRGRSVVAIVASIDVQVTRWYSRVYFQDVNEEVINILQKGMVDCLKKYQEVTHQVPEKVFIYRDGVGDGQIPVVKNYEVNQITQSVADFVKTMNKPVPKVTLVLVQKRINTKIYRQTGPAQFENPPHGTVLDKIVTRPQLNDFFLVSQHVNQGTVTPTHYVTIHDENAMPADRIQRLTYKMTHLYYNWPGNIRVPAPCQYAHKMAYLIGQNVKKVPDESICDKLFYL